MESAIPRRLPLCSEPAPTPLTVMRIELTHFLPLSPEETFDVCTDVSKFADRCENIVECEMVTDGPVGLGTKFKETRVMFGKKATEEMEFTVFERPNRWALAADSHGAKYLTEFSTAPKDGGTEITFSFSSEPYTMMAKIMGFIFRGMAKSCMKMVKKDLDDLAASLEKEAATSA